MQYERSYTSLYESSLLEVGDFRCASVEVDRVVEDNISPRAFICFPRRGSFYHQRRGKKEFADPNHVLFFSVGERVKISYPRSEGDDSTFFSISSELLREILKPTHPELAESETPLFPFCQVLSDPGTFLKHRLILDLVDRVGGGESIAVEEKVIDLAQRSILSGAEGTSFESEDIRPATRRAHREQVEHAKTLLAKHYQKNLDLNDIARAVASSPYHLARIFKREVGVPIHRYLNRLRLRASLDYLPEWELGLTDLALELGYSSHSHFSEAFRREFGLSPSELRRGVTVKRMLELDAGFNPLH